ncbi:MAG: hypothetical protein KIT76_13165 [Pseudolabrys sp.]|nr:hypothetical protein [Pseudolabrys sp.]
MADLVIKDVDDGTVARLRAMAKAEGVSYYEIVHRAILASLDDNDKAQLRAAAVLTAIGRHT